ncbi:MAG: LysM peptidoglycan-binding domain-containing protein [Anaerolineales bacterium]|nr:LysM peptidoglycan-binding domain-containing protein [Anaerolineales bacterium]
MQICQPTSEVRNNETWGVLKLTLHSDSYDWEFLPIDGQTFTDKGSAPCVTPKNQPFYSTPEPVLAPGTTLISTAAVVAEVAAGGESYTIQAGDTLGTIGARYGLEWSVLAAANGLDAYSILEIGQVIRVPGANQTVAPLVTSEFETTLAGRAPVTNSAPVVVATLVATAPLSSQSIGSKYTVQAGDTLFGLVLRFGVAQQVLMDANSLTDGDFLQIGQQLVIPGTTASSLAGQSPTPALTAVVTKTVPTVSSAAPAATPNSAASTPVAKYHTVASGDTIISIALTYNKDWQALLELNGLKPDTILQIGQRVRID